MFRNTLSEGDDFYSCMAGLTLLLRIDFSRGAYTAGTIGPPLTPHIASTLV